MEEKTHTQHMQKSNGKSEYIQCFILKKAKKDVLVFFSFFQHFQDEEACTHFVTP